jgi:hypothetical protein
VRLLFFILVLANVAAFGYFTYHEQGAGGARLVHPALNAERIQQVSPEQLVLKAGTLPAPIKSSCWIWSGFKPTDLTAVRASLDKMALRDKLTQPSQEEFWLYLPPLKNKKEAEKKLEALTNLNINDGKLVEESGKWHFAISFGAYPTEDGATVRLNQLKEKGLSAASILKREAPGNAIVLKQIDEKTVTELNQLKAGYPGSELKETECAG